MDGKRNVTHFSSIDAMFSLWASPKNFLAGALRVFGLFSLWTNSKNFSTRALRVWRHRGSPPDPRAWKRCVSYLNSAFHNAPYVFSATDATLRIYIMGTGWINATLRIGIAGT